MLKQRILTAIVLLAILLPALFYPSHVPFACVMLVLIGAGAWEWGRLNGYGQRLSVFLGVETVALCALSWWLGLLDRSLLLMWLLASAAWVLGGAALLRVAV
ncbi:MAG TPA: phosphatidate cytidylyltransferase, partial [Variovorax sp.]|nr:phosphatidate cytidylyltransferase [Variovorax sp.]